MLLATTGVMLQPTNGDGRGMDEEAEKPAIMTVLRAETDAYMRRDFPALAQHWMHSPQARLMIAFASLGARVVEGWDAIAARLQSIMERLSQSHDIAERLNWEKVNIVLGADLAWVSYDQIGTDTGDDFEMAGLQ